MILVEDGVLPLEHMEKYLATNKRVTSARWGKNPFKCLGSTSTPAHVPNLQKSWAARLVLKCPKRPSFALITVIGVQARDRSEVGPFEIRLVLGCCCCCCCREFQPLEFLRGHANFSIFLTDSTAGI